MFDFRINNFLKIKNIKKCSRFGFNSNKMWTQKILNTSDWRCWSYWHNLDNNDYVLTFADRDVKPTKGCFRVKWILHFVVSL